MRNLWQGDLDQRFKQASLHLRLEKVYLRAAHPVRRDRHAAGALQHGLGDHAGVRRSGARSIIFALSVLLDRGEPCDSGQDTPHEAALQQPSARLNPLAVCYSLGQQSE